MMDEVSTLFDDISGELPDHVEHVSRIAEALMCFHDAREQTYQMSFAKRGEGGVWQNLGRKTDRIDGLSKRVFTAVGADKPVGNSGVTLVDTLADIVVYALKWLDVIARTRPGDFETWVRDVFCKDTGLEFGTAMDLFGVSPQVRLMTKEEQEWVEQRKDKVNTLRKKKLGPYTAQQYTEQDLKADLADPANWVKK